MYHVVLREGVLGIKVSGSQEVKLALRSLYLTIHLTM